MNQKLIVELSNHHVHLTEEVQKQLFGDCAPQVKKYLNEDKTEYATDATITLAGPKGEIRNVRVLGPCRSFTQAEILKGDCFKLGVDAPVRDSGNLEGAAVLKLIGPAGSVELACGILALRHIHMPRPMIEALGLKDRQMVSVRTCGERSLTFHRVLVRAAKSSAFVMHIDTEEGNAAGIASGSEAELVADDGC